MMREANAATSAATVEAADRAARPGQERVAAEVQALHRSAGNRAAGAVAAALASRGRSQRSPGEGASAGAERPERCGCGAPSSGGDCDRCASTQTQLARAVTERSVARVPLWAGIGARIFGEVVIPAAIGYCGASSYYESFRDTESFYRDFAAITGRQARREEWDEWGHAYVACRTAERCGTEVADIAGTAVETLHEAGHQLSRGRIAHDSLPEDLYNEAYGRRLAERDVDCYLATVSAAANNRLHLPSQRATTTGE
jgi:hypothetical protein